jgi:hypothetical protein
MGATEVEVAIDTAALIDLAGRGRFHLFVVDADAAIFPACPVAGGDADAVRDLVARLRAAEATAAAAEAALLPRVSCDDGWCPARRPAALVGIAGRLADHAGLLTAGFCSVLPKPLTRCAVQAAVRSVLSPAPVCSGSEAAHGGAAAGGSAVGGHVEGGTASLAGPAAVRILIVEGAETPAADPWPVPAAEAKAASLTARADCSTTQFLGLTFELWGFKISWYWMGQPPSRGNLLSCSAIAHDYEQ